MKNLLLPLLLLPLSVHASIKDWDYMPFIEYADVSPSKMISQGRNFDLLKTLWDEPRTTQSLETSGFDFSDVDTTLLLRQGMIYQDNGICYSAIPFLDTLAVNHLRDKARKLAKRIIDETQPEMKSFLSTLDTAGYSESAFALTHSLVFDDLIWNNLNVSMENATIHPTDSMTWNGVYYFFRPEATDKYGTNGIGLAKNKMFKFAWGENSNAHLCTAFIKTSILDAIKTILAGEEPTEKMIQDCRKFGVFDDNNQLTIPILDGQDPISKAADIWAKAAATSFEKAFDEAEIAAIIGLPANRHTATCKVIVYHELLTEIDKYLDSTRLLPIPDVLKAQTPANKTHTARTAYITTR